MIPAIDRLSCLMNVALDRVDKKDGVKNLASALAERMPAVIHALADLAISNDVSPSMRARCSTLLFTAWSKVTRLKDRAEVRQEVVAKAAAARESAKARHQRLRNEAAEILQRENRKKERKSKLLAAALSEVSKLGGTQ